MLGNVSDRFWWISGVKILKRSVWLEGWLLEKENIFMAYNEGLLWEPSDTSHKVKSFQLSKVTNITN